MALPAKLAPPMMQCASCPRNAPQCPVPAMPSLRPATKPDYNERDPNQARGYRAPMAIGREGAAARSHLVVLQL